MKKIYFMLAMMVTASSFAQQISNGGFNNWSGSPSRPTGWSTFESATSGVVSGFATKDTTLGNYLEGTASLKLIADSANVPGQGNVLIPGTAAYGTISVGINGIGFQGLAYTAKPDSIKFLFKYQGAGNDSATFELYFTRWNADSNRTEVVVGGYIPIGSTGNQWGQARIALSYPPNVSHDSLLIILSSSDNPVDGSVAHFDDVKFVFNNTTGVQEVSLDYADVVLFPNPTTEVVSFKSANDLSNMNIRIYGLNGQLVSNQPLVNNSADVRDLGAGTYVFELVEQSSVAVKGKFNVVK